MLQFQRFVKIILGFLLALQGANALAAEEVTVINPVNFKTWRDQQIVDAQNRLARVSNRLTLLNSGKIQAQDLAAEISSENSAEANQQTALAVESSRILKLGPKDLLARLEKEQERAQKNLEYARELALEDYFLVYLSQFQNNPEILAGIASKLSKDEVTQLLKTLLKNTTQALPNDATRKRSLATPPIEASNRTSTF